jgi:hypothetical protein
MIKFWKIKNTKNISVILIADKSIYKGKIKTEDLNHFSKELESNIIPQGLFGIPFSYIEKIEHQENKKDIKIYFGDGSEEELTSADQALKNEIFNYLKETIPNLKYSKEIPSIFKYAKPPLFAVLFTTGIFVWSLYYAVQLGNGVEYELAGSAGITSMMYAMGLLGTLKIVMLFFFIIEIAVYSLFKKNKSRTEIAQLNRHIK